MLNVLIALIVYLLLFILLFASLLIGQSVGRKYRETHPDQKLVVVKVAEGTVFALLGLLIAFTFSGAYDRFEARKARIIDEVNAVETAYLRIGLLAPAQQAPMRELIHQYLQARIDMYKKMSEVNNIDQELHNIIGIRNQIWQQTLAATSITNQQAATMLFVPAINNMFEIATTRFAIRLIHPPFAIFGLLLILASMGSFLTGYSMARNNYYHSIYSISFVAITALTLYIIVDLEFPRSGLIRVDAFDHLLVRLQHHLPQNPGNFIPTLK